MSEERLIELEIKVAYQDDLLHTLNNIISEHQQQIQRLEKTCQLLHERINSLSTENRSDHAPVDEVPPHY